jgi:hypothetical protein
MAVFSSVAFSARGYDQFKSLQPAHAPAANLSRILKGRKTHISENASDVPARFPLEKQKHN